MLDDSNQILLAIVCFAVTSEKLEYNLESVLIEIAYNVFHIVGRSSSLYLQKCSVIS